MCVHKFGQSVDSVVSGDDVNVVGQLAILLVLFIQPRRLVACMGRDEAMRFYQDFRAVVLTMSNKVITEMMIAPLDDPRIVLDLRSQI